MGDLAAAKHEVDSNPLTQANLRRTDFAYEKDHRFKILHANLLKAWLVSHKGGTKTQRLQTFLEWNTKDLVSDYVGVIFALIYLSDRRTGKMIKHCDSDDRQLVLKGITNSTWDMYYLTALEKLHEVAAGRCIWFFCTRDRTLLEVASHRDAVTPEKIGAFIEEYYTGEGVEAFNDYMNKINGRCDRESHIAKVCANLDAIVAGLVKEVLASPYCISARLQYFGKRIGRIGRIGRIRWIGWLGPEGGVPPVVVGLGRAPREAAVGGVGLAVRALPGEFDRRSGLRGIAHGLFSRLLRPTGYRLKNPSAPCPQARRFWRGHHPHALRFLWV